MKIRTASAPGTGSGYPWLARMRNPIPRANLDWTGVRRRASTMGSTFMSTGRNVDLPGRD